MSNKLTTYLKESWVEIKKVNWPTRRETIRHSVSILILTTAVALFLSGADYVLKAMLKLIIK